MWNLVELGWRPFFAAQLDDADESCLPVSNSPAPTSRTADDALAHDAGAWPAVHREKDGEH
jgi:hypothetical protein